MSPSLSQSAIGTGRRSNSRKARLRQATASPCQRPGTGSPPSTECPPVSGYPPGTPVIMIAAGTGLAPFRGAIADRRALTASGAQLPTALCYFGCDGPDTDYLYADELREAERAGAVSMRPVFSHAPVDGLRFVQHRIAAESAEVWELLEAGARVHVCGDGARMAPGVRDAFRELYVRNTPGADEAAAESWLQELTARGRYVEDVYAG